MKKWNTPEIAALDLNATESGVLCTEYEFWPFINDNLKKCDQNNNNTNNNNESNNTSTTTDNDETTNSLS